MIALQADSQHGLEVVNFYNLQQVLEVWYAYVVQQRGGHMAEVQPHVDSVDPGTIGHIDRVAFPRRCQWRQTPFCNTKT